LQQGLYGYRKGGYHPVNLNEAYSAGRYRVVFKLGWGQFSTVWLCMDEVEKKHVAVKFVKSATHYTEAARDEIEIMGSLKPVVCSARSPWVTCCGPVVLAQFGVVFGLIG
jgi:hypothetical protein